jgi:hypothetical protein
VWAHNPSNIWQKIRTQNGNANAAGYTENVDDAYAYLQNWSGNDYDITATVHWSGIQAGEVEILLRVSDSATQIHAYEFLYNVGGSWQLVRWNGDHSDYVVIHPGGGVPGNATDGNQIRARIVGNSISLYWRQTSADSWTTLLSNFSDPGGGGGSPIATGKPGMAFYVHAPVPLNTIGFKDYSVTAL